MVHIENFIIYYKDLLLDKCNIIRFLPDSTAVPKTPPLSRGTGVASAKDER